MIFDNLMFKSIIEDKNISKGKYLVPDIDHVILTFRMKHIINDTYLVGEQLMACKMTFGK